MANIILEKATGRGQKLLGADFKEHHAYIVRNMEATRGILYKEATPLSESPLDTGSVLPKVRGLQDLVKGLTARVNNRNKAAPTPFLFLSHGEEHAGKKLFEDLRTNGFATEDSEGRSLETSVTPGNYCEYLVIDCQRDGTSCLRLEVEMVDKAVEIVAAHLYFIKRTVTGYDTLRMIPPECAPGSESKVAIISTFTLDDMHMHMPRGRVPTIPKQKTIFLTGALSREFRLEDFGSDAVEVIIDELISEEDSGSSHESSRTSPSSVTHSVAQHNPSLGEDCVPIGRPSKIQKRHHAEQSPIITPAEPSSNVAVTVRRTTCSRKGHRKHMQSVLRRSCALDESQGSRLIDVAMDLLRPGGEFIDDARIKFHLPSHTHEFTPTETNIGYGLRSLVDDFGFLDRSDVCQETKTNWFDALKLRTIEAFRKENK